MSSISPTSRSFRSLPNISEEEEEKQVDPIAQFKMKCSQVVEQEQLNEAHWGSENWKSLFPYLTQNVLDDAFLQMERALSIFFPELRGIAIVRPAKKISRVEKKMTEQRAGSPNYFKVISDFLALRMPCRISEIKQFVEKISEITLKRKGIVWVRSADEKRVGQFFDRETNQFTDIIQYIYVYLPEIGYPVEFQIGHPFAMYTFSIDSEIRDHPHCHKIDLWNKGFYELVRSYILEKANGVPLNQENRKQQIHERAEEIHKDPSGKAVPISNMLREMIDSL